MEPEELRDDIREALERRLVPSPGLEARVLAALPEAPARPGRPLPRPEWAAPRWVALVAVLVTGVLVVSLVLWMRAPHTAPAGPAQFGPAIVDVQLTSPEAGWIVRTQTNGTTVGRSVTAVERTDDGGATWREQLRIDGYHGDMRADRDGVHAVAWAIDEHEIPCPRAPSRPVHQGHCVSPAQLRAYQTSDAGLTWTPLPATPAEAAAFVDPLHGWLVTFALPLYDVQRTDDGGRTWTHVGNVESPQTVADGMLEFTDANTGWLDLGRDAEPGHTDLLATHDGGRTWREVTLPVAPVPVRWQRAHVPAMAGSHGVLTLFGERATGSPSPGPARPGLDTGLVATTTDGGVTWSAPVLSADLTAPGPWLAEAAFVLDDGHAWVSLDRIDQLTARGILLTTADAGATWTGRPAPRLDSMSFLNERDGWAIGVDGSGGRSRLLRTADGGATWTRVALPRGPLTSG